MRFVALALAFAIALTACGDDDGDWQAAPITPEASPTAARTPRTTPAASATATAPAAAPTAAPATPAPATPGGSSITISAVGDISLAREVVDRMEAQGAGYPYALIAPLLTGDIVIGNLEGALTDRGDPWPKGYNFRTPPRFATGLRDAGFDVVSLANNHTMDYGVIGLEDTVLALDAAGVAHSGSGDIRHGASAATYVRADGFVVAVISCALSPDEGGGFSIREWAQPAEGGPGIFICDGAAFPTAIDEARTKGQADFVLVSMHAGDEYVNTPNATQRAVAGAALAAGADVVLGHHAHVVQPVEQRGSQLIAWGLGNFIFDLDPVDLANIPIPRVSLILNVTLTKGAGVTAWDAIPVTQDADEDRPRPATPAEADILHRLLAP